MKLRDKSDIMRDALKQLSGSPGASAEASAWLILMCSTDNPKTAKEAIGRAMSLGVGEMDLALACAKTDASVALKELMDLGLADEKTIIHESSGYVKGLVAHLVTEGSLKCMELLGVARLMSARDESCHVYGKKARSALFIAAGGQLAYTLKALMGLLSMPWPKEELNQALELLIGKTDVADGAGNSGEERRLAHEAIHALIKAGADINARAQGLADWDKARRKTKGDALGMIWARAESKLELFMLKMDSGAHKKQHGNRWPEGWDEMLKEPRVDACAQKFWPALKATGFLNDPEHLADLFAEGQIAPWRLRAMAQESVFSEAVNGIHAPKMLQGALRRLEIGEIHSAFEGMRLIKEKRGKSWGAQEGASALRGVLSVKEALDGNSKAWGEMLKELIPEMEEGSAKETCLSAIDWFKAQEEGRQKIAGKRWEESRVWLQSAERFAGAEEVSLHFETLGDGIPQDKKALKI